MRAFVLGFVAGTAWLQHASELPGASLAPLVLAGLLAAWRWPGTVAIAALAVAGLAAGHDWAAWRAGLRLADALPEAWEGRDIVLEGVVSGLPQAGERGVRFAFDPDRVRTAGASVPARIVLTRYEAPARAQAPESLPAQPELRPGQRWQFAVRLKRPRGLANPHAFDFEPWALERGLRATGYVRQSPRPELLAEHEPGWPQTIHRVRGDIREAMRARLGEARFAGVLVALAIGDQDAIAPEDWRVFWRTGVGHLMSISGLHVTMFASLAFALAAFLWSRVPALVLALPARKAGTVAGLAAALAYTLAAGYAVPAQRTLLMLATAAAFLLADRLASPSRVLAAAVLVVLAVDPWAVLSPGFWLSFGAVASILYVLALRAGGVGWATEAVVTQAAVTVALWPILAAWFGEASMVSPLANAIAIPVVSLAVVPLSVAGALLPLPWLLTLAHALLEATMVPLEWLAGLPFAVAEYPAAPALAVAGAVVGALLLLAPRGVPLRAAGVLLLAPLALYRASAPAAGEAWIDVLDVGQGLAVVVRTTNHALAYDAGPDWDGDSDAGSRVVVPFLRGEGVRRLDGMVLTHADDDHAGGGESVARSRAPVWLLSSLAPDDERHGLAPWSLPCTAGTRWQWDGVAFEVLHPREAALRSRVGRENDRSCVLRVEAAGASMLLAGDIEWRSEAELVAAAREGLRADVLLVPHHGSRSSSTPAFLAAVAPAIAVIPVGWRNRFGHPSPVVLSRYAARGIRVLRTDLDGAIRVRLPANAEEAIAVNRQAEQSRYWSDRRRK